MENNDEEIAVKKAKLNNDIQENECINNVNNNNNVLTSLSYIVNNNNNNNNNINNINNNKLKDKYDKDKILDQDELNNKMMLLKGIEYEKEIPDNIINRLSNDKYVIVYVRLTNLLENIFENITKIDFLEYDLNNNDHNDDDYKLVRELIKEYNNECINHEYYACKNSSDIYKLKKKLKKIPSVLMFLNAKNEITSFDYKNDNINYINDKKSIYYNRKSISYPKLLIFDLNKVLVYRKKLTSEFILRPYVIDFLHILSTVGKYQIAIWTSAKKKSVCDIMNKLFSSLNFQPYFEWYQPMCSVVPPPPVCNLINKSIQNNIDRIPIFTKDLYKVWSEFPIFWQYNTILIDDSPVKCINNNSFNCLHPLPFDLSDQIIPNSSLQDTCFNLLDEELKPSGNLCKYLLKYSQYNDSIEKFVVENLNL